jgi:hypothetical protein
MLSLDEPVKVLKMEKICLSETLASTDESTRRQNPEEQHRQCNSLLFLRNICVQPKECTDSNPGDYHQFGDIPSSQGR